VDLMVVDALQYANPVLKITEKIHDPEQFVRLDDTLLKQIELWGSAPGWRACEEDDRHMRKAQAVVLRLRNRDMYKFCGEVVVPNNVCSNWGVPTAHDFADLLPDGSGVVPGDVIVDILKQNLTAGNSNPLDKVSFYDTYESTEKRTLKHSDVTVLELLNHEEHKLRVYSRKSDAESRQAVTAAFERYVAQHFPTQGIMGTPKRPQTCSKLPGGAMADGSRKRKLFETMATAV